MFSLTLLILKHTRLHSRFSVKDTLNYYYFILFDIKRFKMSLKHFFTFNFFSNKIKYF